MVKVKTYAMSIVSLVVALMIIFFVLYQLHTHFGNNIVGKLAGDVGARASGQSYNYN